MKNTNLLLFIFIVLVVTGCADKVPLKEAYLLSPVGFWHGLWHGMICPFSFFWGLLDSSTAIYAVYNNGGWYDFGFLIGIGAFTSSVSSKSKK